MGIQGIIKRWWVSLAFFGVLAMAQGLLFLVEPVMANVLSVAEFEDKDFSEWQPFSTLNGTGGSEFPKVIPFETEQSGNPSNSLQLKVGQIQYDPEDEPQQGAGIGLRVVTKDGNLVLSVHVAVAYHSTKKKRNLAGGLFEWVVDDQVVARHDVGPIANHAVVRHHFQTRHSVKEGPHSVQLRVTRPFVSHPQQEAPFQYIDNLRVVFQPNP